MLMMMGYIKTLHQTSPSNKLMVALTIPHGRFHISLENKDDSTTWQLIGIICADMFKESCVISLLCLDYFQVVDGKESLCDC